MWQSWNLTPALILRLKLFTGACSAVDPVRLSVDSVRNGAPWHSLQIPSPGQGCRWLPCPWFYHWPWLFLALSEEGEAPLPGCGSAAVPYAGTTRAQETCSAHQPLWSVASWKGQINHALILMGQKVSAFPFYAVKGPLYAALPLMHREMPSVSEKQKGSLLTRKKNMPKQSTLSVLGNN